MKAICAWCQVEGKSGILHELPSTSNLDERYGLCWEHMVDMFRAGRARPRPVQDEGSPRFLMIVARDHARVFPRLRLQFLDDPRVQVIMDRRHEDGHHGEERRKTVDYWENLRYHPVVLVPVAGRLQTPAQPPRPSPAPVAPRAVEPAPRSVRVVQQMDELRHWFTTGEQLFRHVAPSLVDTLGTLQQRAEDAERHAEHLKLEVGERDVKLMGLQADVERLARERVETVQALAAAVSEIERLTRAVIDALEALPILRDATGRDRLRGT